MTLARTPTAVDTIADEHVDALAALDPVGATFAGIAGHDAELPEYTPDWWGAMAEHRRGVLAALDSARAIDTNDRITVAALREELAVAQSLYELGANEQSLNVIESPLQAIREAFDLMPTDTVEHWDTAARRLSAVPAAVDGYLSSLRRAAERGDVSPARQVRACINQCSDNIGTDGFFASFAGGASTAGRSLPDSLRADLNRGSEAASAAYERLAAYLRDELLAQAPEADPVGRERYALASRSFLGTAIDLDETYAWGIGELARVRADMMATAGQIVPGGSIDDAKAVLNNDPTRLLHGTDALQAWMQGKSDAALAALTGTHFDIPEPIRHLDCRIAPTSRGGIYYTGPSEDLATRPGTMWWSVPKDETEFVTWQELTTVYHEGVPGHHLQIAQTTYRRDQLNRWRRLLSWVSGHGEGWALYAERLMAELGFLDDPGDRLGMLDSQSLRAARVVLDIGVHCGLTAPSQVGGGEWTYDKAWDFLRANSSMSEGQLRFELDRYLGWPGQAPSYKIGERYWLELRETARSAAGGAFDLAVFHRRALDIGSVGLDVLRAAVLEEI